ncbi:MAG: UPF0175 family protein [Balneolaceae bacterium]|nr:MAG: UPF0175 family protein [Balneolaceae bacterium]
MKKLILEIPDHLNLDGKEAALMLAGKLYEEGRLTLGEASSLAGYTKREFMEKMGDHGISVFNYPAEELDKDVNNASKYRR